MRQHLVSKTAIRAFLKKEGKRVSVPSFGQMEDEFRAMLLRAVKRADMNKRQTILLQDI